MKHPILLSLFLLSFLILGITFSPTITSWVGESACEDCPCDQERVSLTNGEDQPEEKEACPPLCSDCDCVILRTVHRILPLNSLVIPNTVKMVFLLEPEDLLPSGVTRKFFQPPRFST